MVKNPCLHDSKNRHSFFTEKDNIPTEPAKPSEPDTNEEENKTEEEEEEEENEEPEPDEPKQPPEPSHGTDEDKRRSFYSFYFILPQLIYLVRALFR